MISIAINGFGRIGRTFLRTILQDQHAKKQIKVAVINGGPMDISTMAHLFKYDTVMGIYAGSVRGEKDQLRVDDVSIALVAQRDPLPHLWKSYKVDWVVDCSGCYTQRDQAEHHIQAGAKAVLISAPATDEDVSLIPGVNDDVFDPERHKIVSLGSCTTNAMMTTLKVLHDTCHINHAFVTTVHAYTSTQSLLDSCGTDLRRARAAAVNIVPAHTGAEEMVGKIMPELKDRVYASAVRVPVDCVSLLDVTAWVEKKVTVKQVHNAIEDAAKGRMKNSIDIVYEPLVSSDFKGNSKSVIIDGLLSHVEEQVVKVYGWYDNEWGYSCRMKDFLINILEKN